MFPRVGLAGVILCLLCAIVWLAYRPLRGRDKANWLVAQGTIQSVGTVVVYAGRDSHSTDVGDYYFKVNDEFYSGRLTVTDVAYSTDRSPKVLVGQTIQVRYDPRNPENHSVATLELDSFRLSAFYEPFGQDVEPIVLNIDKI